jgi:hypothetical protein
MSEKVQTPQEKDDVFNIHAFCGTPYLWRVQKSGLQLMPPSPKPPLRIIETGP